MAMGTTSRKRPAPSAVRAAPARLSLRKSPRPTSALSAEGGEDGEAVVASSAPKTLHERLDDEVQRAEADGAGRRQREAELKTMLRRYDGDGDGERESIAGGM